MKCDAHPPTIKINMYFASPIDEEGQQSQAIIFNQCGVSWKGDPTPRFITGIVKLEWQTFANAIDHADLTQISKYLDLLHSGKHLAPKRIF